MISPLAWMLLGLVLLATAFWGKQRLLAASRADWERPWLNVLDGLNRIFCHRYHRMRRIHVALPARGPALLVANHISGLDPLLMIAACHRPLRFLIAREQYQRFGLQWLFRAVGCIPVERGGNIKPALAAARQALHAGEVVALFPQGRIHLKQEPPIRLKQGTVHLARFSGAPVYSLQIDGVKAAGHTLWAVFRRSQVRVQVFPPLYYHKSEPDQILTVLERQFSQAD